MLSWIFIVLLPSAVFCQLCLLYDHFVNQLKAFISPHIKLCTQINEKYYMCLHMSFYDFVAVPCGKDYTCPFYAYNYPIKHMFL